MTIAVLGATGRIGRRVTASLLARNRAVLALGRNPERLARLGTAYRQTDCTDIQTLSAALDGAETIVNCIHARVTPSVLAALPSSARHVVVVGSARCHTRFPDEAARQVNRAERLLRDHPVPSLILHPTMIYGEDGENNVQRIAAWIRRFGILPLPNGGQSLIQPVHADDVAASVTAAVLHHVAGGSIILAGPEPCRQCDFMRAIAEAAGSRVRILPAPVWSLMLAGRLLRLFPSLPQVRDDEIRRLTEDKAFSITPMTGRLGIHPRPLRQGLAQTFSGGGAP